MFSIIAELLLRHRTVHVALSNTFPIWSAMFSVIVENLRIFILSRIFVGDGYGEQGDNSAPLAKGRGYFLCLIRKRQS